MLRPKRGNVSAFEPPNETHAPIARAIEQITGLPAECVSERTPGFQEASRIFDGLAPAGFRNLGRPLALEPSPPVQIPLRNAAGRSGFAFFKRRSIYYSSPWSEFVKDDRFVCGKLRF
jgi:hypothetical protein